MSAGHTPGPWVFNELNMVHAPKHGYITRDICRMDGSTMAAFERIANARLIAAAPDLLSVVKSVALRGLHTMQGSETFVCTCSQCALTLEAIDALKKAGI